jgi:Mitochondrial carrier protein
MQKSYREEGACVFVRGLSATLTRAFIVSAVIFSAYDEALKLLGGQDVMQAAN